MSLASYYCLLLKYLRGGTKVENVAWLHRNVRKNTQLERKGLHSQSSKIDDCNGLIWKYFDGAYAKTIKVIFLLFAPFLRKIHFSRPRKRRVNKQNTQLKTTGFKVLKSTITTVPTLDIEIFCRAAWANLNLIFKLIFAYLFGCHMAIRYTHLATGLIRPFKAILFFPQADFACLILLYFRHIWQLIYHVLGIYRFHLIWSFFLSFNQVIGYFAPRAYIFVFSLLWRLRNLLERSPTRLPATHTRYHDLASKIAYFLHNKSPSKHEWELQ